MQKEMKGLLKSQNADFAAKTTHTANVQPLAKHTGDAAKEITLQSYAEHATSVLFAQTTWKET